MTEFNQGVPTLFVEKSILDVEDKLIQQGYSYAVLQFKDPKLNYVGNESAIGLYNRFGISPQQSQQRDSYVAGLYDTIVFSNAELLKGVRLLNATNGKEITYIVTYYRY